MWHHSRQQTTYDWADDKIILRNKKVATVEAYITMLMVEPSLDSSICIYAKKNVKIGH